MEQIEQPQREFNLAAMRKQHHAMAKDFAFGFLPKGMKAEKLEIFRQDPAFLELIAHYKKT